MVTWEVTRDLGEAVSDITKLLQVWSQETQNLFWISQTRMLRWKPLRSPTNPHLALKTGQMYLFHVPLYLHTDIQCFQVCNVR